MPLPDWFWEEDPQPSDLRARAKTAFFGTLYGGTLPLGVLSDFSARPTTGKSTKLNIPKARQTNHAYAQGTFTDSVKAARIDMETIKRLLDMGTLTMAEAEELARASA